MVSDVGLLKCMRSSCYSSCYDRVNNLPC